MKLAFKGDVKAQEFLLDISLVMLKKLWSDAFGQKFETEEIQMSLEESQIHRKNYHKNVTRWLVEDGYGKHIGGIFNRMKIQFGLPLDNVHEYTLEQKRLINEMERVYNIVRTMNPDIDHRKACFATRDAILATGDFTFC